MTSLDAYAQALNTAWKNELTQRDAENKTGIIDDRRRTTADAMRSHGTNIMHTRPPLQRLKKQRQKLLHTLTTTTTPEQHAITTGHIHAITTAITHLHPTRSETRS